MEIRREFEVSVPEGTSRAEEERVIQAAIEAEEEKLLDDLLGPLK